ncbi:unnamed protein product [Prunus brigantina]
MIPGSNPVPSRLGTGLCARFPWPPRTLLKVPWAQHGKVLMRLPNLSPGAYQLREGGSPLVSKLILTKGLNLATSSSQRICISTI